MRRTLWIAIAAFVTVLPVGILGQKDWPTYGHDVGGMRYSPLTQITPANVPTLKRAWTYDTGENASSFQVTPLVVGTVMYLSTPAQKLVALDAETGKELWKHDTATKRGGTHRGVSYWPGDGKNAPRVLFSTGDSRLLAVDAKTGMPVATFGKNGEVNLRVGVADDFPDANYYLSSPPAVFKDLIILGPRVSESAPQGKGPAGDIRAFNAVTGALVWSFHTRPRAGEPGAETWGPAFEGAAGPSAWGGFTVDTARDLVFVPTGQVSGGGPPESRTGINLYANCLLALDINTGKLKWYFQAVHHDQWDFDVSAPPALIDVKQGNRTVPAVAQLTKQGMLFILDRTTGQPLYGVEEMPVPTAPGTGTWPTQPFPIKPAPLARLALKQTELSKISPQAEAYCKAAMDGRDVVPYALTRPMFSSGVGGGNWGGVAFDPSRGLIFANTSDMGKAPSLDLPNKPNSNRFVDPDYYPCNQPPWGTLTAINANTGDVAWRVPLGSYKELEAKGIKNTGTPNLGGAIATASGVVFIGATNDKRFRAFDSATGKELWMEEMGAHALAVPVTYEGRNGKQFVVIATGGTGLLAAVGPRETTPTQYKGTIVAFALP